MKRCIGMGLVILLVGGCEFLPSTPQTSGSATEPEPPATPEEPNNPEEMGPETSSSITPIDPATPPTLPTATVEPGTWGTGSLVPPASIEDESSICWTLKPQGNQVALLSVGMDTGTVLEVARYTSGLTGSFHTSGMGFDGDHTLAFPGYEGNSFAWMTIDLDSGVMEVGESSNYSMSVTWTGEGWRAPGMLDSDIYATTADLLAGTPTAIGHRLWETRIQQAPDGLIYGAWHSTDTIVVIDPDTGDDVDEILLEGFDTWVHGIGITDDYLHVIDDGRGDTGISGFRIVRFNHDGDAINEVSVPWSSGLWCHTRPE